MQNPAGQLQICLQHAAGRVVGVAIEPEPSRSLEPLLCGKTPAQLLATLPLLYGVCGMAQRLAAWRAWQAAEARAIPADTERAQQLLVNLESLREYLLRMRLGWVGLGWVGLGDEPAQGDWLKASLGLLGQLLARADGLLFVEAAAFAERPRLHSNTETLDALLKGLGESLAEEVFGCPLPEWRQIQDMKALEDWLGAVHNPVTAWLRSLLANGRARLGASSCAWLSELSGLSGLPELEFDALHQRLQGPDAADFVARPDWQGQCRETGALARQAHRPLMQQLLQTQDTGLLARSVAPLLEIAAIAGEPSAPLAQTSSTDCHVQPFGIGQVESARGRLIHWLKLEDGLVTRHLVLAPTQWNCHPQGPLAQGLLGLGGLVLDETELRLYARAIIQAMDPCLEWQLNLRYRQ